MNNNLDSNLDKNMPSALGFSGRIAQFSTHSQLTPLLAMVGLLLGIFAAFITPREEEPQIDVTMANVFIPFSGASAVNVETLVTNPMEQILGEIPDVEHIYSASRPGMAVFTVQFKVGVPRTEALVRLYNATQSNADWRPVNSGIGQVLVKPKGIDDVPIVALTLWYKNSKKAAYELTQVAHSLENELKRVKGTRDIDTLGGSANIVNVELDVQKLNQYGVDINELRLSLAQKNSVSHAGNIISNNQTIPVQVGEFFSRPEELAGLVIGIHAGKPVYLENVANINLSPAENTHYVWTSFTSDKTIYPAVTLQISKKSGENAVNIADGILQRIEQLKGTVIPQDIEVSVTRNYGATANEKANKLIQKLFFATISVILLVAFTMGIREAIVVGAAVILTLGITLFASWAYGFTLNRVSLFALIFSIGILVDDAIVVVENIHRHLSLDKTNKSLLAIIPNAVSEVGGPTILATFTVIAALLPMAFVSGLMGPYMSPIPINASMGMLTSLVIAFTFTPWLSNKLLKSHSPHAEHSTDSSESASSRFFTNVLTPFLGVKNRRNRYKLGFSLIGLIFLACSLVGMKWVVLKMLPFDNKSEFQVVVDMPEDSALEHTNAVLSELTNYLLTIKEVTDVQVYAGTASPIGFNGLVRQYYLREAQNLGDIQVNLKDKHDRDRTSHAIAQSTRDSLTKIGDKYHAIIKVVEVPPGPPVQSPLVAEVYGANYQGQILQAKKLKAEFKKIPDLVDIDDSSEINENRFVIAIDQIKASKLGVSAAQITSALAIALGNNSNISSDRNISELHTGHAKYPIPIQLNVPFKDKSDINNILNSKVRSQSGVLIPLSSVTSVKTAQWEQTIYHKDLLPVVYVTGDMAGKLDSPLYGMLEVVGQLGDTITQYFIKQPNIAFEYSIKWDGEWQITYETFRDMGAAYSVGLLLIYLLVVGQFGSYSVPLIIMAPIPLTLIGIMPGHAIMGAQFTATSMIGMIALAGIIVRNSILLVDFINQSIASGVELEQSIIQAASVRAKPIILTALAATLGAFFILDDPIFNGLAVSLIFGILVSTVLTLVVIPLLYYSLLRRST